MSLNLKCSFLTEYNIYHNKNYKVTAELTWDKILLIILSPKLAWEKFLHSLRIHWYMSAAALKEPEP